MICLLEEGTEDIHSFLLVVFMPGAVLGVRGPENVEQTWFLPL
jgi:hypothetical protein